MAIYHCSAKVISRGSGRSAVAAAAYRSGTKIENEYDGVTHDYTRKQGVVYSEVMLPENAPEAYKDRAILWNAVEKNERANGQLAQEYEFSIPIELPQREWIQFAKNTAYDLFVKDGRPVDIAIHFRETDGKPNPHVHIQSPKRAMDADGNWEAKSEILYLCKNAKGEEKAFTKAELALPENSEWQKQHRYSKDGNPKGKKVYLSPYEVATNPKYKGYERVKGDRQPKTEKHGRKNPKMERWDSKEYLLEIRKGVADKINAELERMGLPQRVDHRSLKDQGIDREPTIHEGVAAQNIEKKGGVADRCEINRDIKQTNEKIAEVKMTMDEVQKSIGIIREDMAWSKVHEGAGDLRIFIRENDTSEAAMQQAYQKLDSLESMAADNVRAAQQTNFHGMQYLEYHVGKSGNERAWIEDRINENLAFIKSVPHFEQYTYGQVDMQRLNETFRADRGEDGYINIARRTPAEQAVIRDAKKADAELCARYDTRYLHNLIAQQNEAQKLRRPSRNRDEELVRQIQESFANLRFMEQNKVYSTEQARDAVKGLEVQQAACISQIKEAEGMVDKLEAALKVPRVLVETKNRFEHNRTDPEYMKNQYHADIKLMKSCMDTMKAANVTDAASLKEAKATVEQYKERIEKLKTTVSGLSAELEGYKRCVAVLDRIEGRVPEQAKSQPTAATVEPKKEQPQATGKEPERVEQKQAAPEQAKSQPAAATVEAQKGQPKTVQQPEPERTQQGKTAAYDVQGVAQQLAAHRAAFIKETVQSQQTMKAYQMNTTYTEKATRIEDLNRERKDLIAQKAQKEQQIESLGRNPFKARERNKLEGQAAEYGAKLEGVEKNLSAELEAMGYSGKDLDKAESAVKDLRQRAAAERQQAQQSRGSGEAGKRAEEAKAAYLAAAKAVPEEQKQAVAAAVAKFQEKPEKVTPETYKAEQAAKQQLDTALQPQQKEQTREPQGKESKQKTMAEIKAEIEKIRQAEKLNPQKAVERSTTKGWTHEGR